MNSAVKQAAFVTAFLPTDRPLPSTWSARASEAICTLIAFRSALHRWQAAGRVDDREFERQLQDLEAAGLAGWVDDLVALAMGGSR